MTFESFFAETYAEARTRFRDACPDAVQIESPCTGPSGEPLATDVAWFGPRGARRVVLITSGVHGLEGLAGSGCQVGWVGSGGPSRIPADTAVMLVHLINPYGVAWLQRETEDQVDLNRNFVEHPFAGAPNEPFENIHEAVSANPQDADFLRAFRAERGDRIFAQAIFGGQYAEPSGLHFGGSAATWSNLTLMKLVADYLQEAREVVHLDYHTGLGPWGHASLVAFLDPKDERIGAAQRRYGPTLMPVGTVVGGHSGYGVAQALPDAEVTALTVEYGTYDFDTECRVVLDDFWLKRHGDPESERGRRIKRDLREYFYPASADWRELIWRRSEQIIARSLLKSSPPQSHL